MRRTGITACGELGTVDVLLSVTARCNRENGVVTLGRQHHEQGGVQLDASPADCDGTSELVDEVHDEFVDPRPFLLGPLAQRCRSRGDLIEVLPDGR